MHKSRLGTLVIDCLTDDLEKEADFWSAVFGFGIQRRYEPGDENYILLEAPLTEPKMLLQKVDHPSRVHIDIETNDIEREVERLEGLGAKRLMKVRDWWVMEAPSGHRFCVVKPQRDDFEKLANVWDDA